MSTTDNNMPEFAPFYLHDIVLRGIGPIVKLDFATSITEKSPRPIIIVGKNGTGKSILLSYIVDALCEFAKESFSDIVKGQRIDNKPFFRIHSSADTSSGSGNGFALLGFRYGTEHLLYGEHHGDELKKNLANEINDRFKAVITHLTNGKQPKSIVCNKGSVSDIFVHNSICYFPANRNELPHWLNHRDFANEVGFSDEYSWLGALGKPLIIDRIFSKNFQWLLDLILDAKVGVDFEYPDQQSDINYKDYKITDDLALKSLIRLSLSNVEFLIKTVLSDSGAKLVLNYRNSGRNRISILRSDGTKIPSLYHLSHGQKILLNIFMTIIRYSDRSDINKSIVLNSITGIVLIDEIDLHMHVEMQYYIIPSLMKLFPRVQFIATSHSPLLLLGLEAAYGSDNIHIIEMPNGTKTTSEVFNEFSESFSILADTKKYRDEIATAISMSHKPIVFTEGESDAMYIRAALTLLGKDKLLNSLVIDMPGKMGQKGSEGAGKSHLDKISGIFSASSHLACRPVMLLYDCDANKTSNTIFPLVRCIPRNQENSVITKGIENLLPSVLITDEYYTTQVIPTGEGRNKTIPSLDKMKLCKYICEQRKNPEDFTLFSQYVFPFLDEFIGLASTKCQTE